MLQNLILTPSSRVLSLPRKGDERLFSEAIDNFEAISNFHLNIIFHVPNLLYLLPGILVTVEKVIYRA